MQWFDVNEKLPEKNEIHDYFDFSIDVIISDGKNIGMGYCEYVIDDSKEELKYSTEVWRDFSNNLITCISGGPEVKFWGYLPDLPK